MRRRTKRGNSLLETALFVPILVTLLVGMVQIGKVTYTYYTLRKTVYSLARYVSTQQGVNFCDPADATIAAAKTFALIGSAEGSGNEPVIPTLTTDMLAVRAERADPNSGDISECDCSSTGCDTSAGGQAPDYVVAYLPDGFEVQIRILFLNPEPVTLRPQVRVRYGGT